MNSQHTLWRPYTPMGDPMPFLEVVDTHGCCLTLADGRTLIDAVGSWWTCLLGYRPPEIINAITQQAQSVPHIMMGGCVNPTTQKLADRLVSCSPGDLSHVFFADSGSVAVEVAMKMALQYHVNRGQPNRQRFLCFLGGYHGDTFGAMSLCDPEEGMHTLFQGGVAWQFAQAVPQTEEDFQALSSLMQQHAGEIAGVFIEPRLQGAGGMRVHSAEQLRRLHTLCQEHNLLFIADEIFTGLGRTGTFWASDSAGITPDILCLGKGLTGGVMSLSATLASPKVFSAFDSTDPAKALMHGPTYMGNPLACAAGLAMLDLLAASDWQRRVTAIENTLTHLLMPMRSHPAVEQVRVLGAMGAIALKKPPKNWDAFKHFFIERGIWLRPFGNVLYTTPAYTISEADLTRIALTMREAVEKFPLDACS